MAKSCVRILESKAYNWIFEPEDTVNYESVADSEVLLKESAKDNDQSQQDGNNPGGKDSQDKDKQQGGVTVGGGGGSVLQPDLTDQTETVEPGDGNTDTETPGVTAPNETTTTVETPDATVSYTQDENGLVSVTVDVNPAAATNGTARVEMPAVKAGSESSAPITLSIPQDIEKSLDVAIPVENANFGTMAVVIDAQGNEIPYPYCYYDGKGSLIVPVGQSCTIKIKNLGKSFADVPGDLNTYPANNIAFLSARGIMTGKGNGETFGPLEDLNRGQLALMLYRYDGSSSQFDNTELPAGVPADEYYAQAAKWAVGTGLMGQGGSLFNGKAPITREQMALILYRYSGSQGADQSKLNNYFDATAISSDEARNAISAMASQGIMGNGTANLRPQDKANRQEVAAMIARWIQPALAEIK